MSQRPEHGAGSDVCERARSVRCGWYMGVGQSLLPDSLCELMLAVLSCCELLLACAEPGLCIGCRCAVKWDQTGPCL